MISYKIFVIFHSSINISYYNKSILDNVVFVNVNPNNNIDYKNLNIINLYEIDNFRPLGKWYAESEVIYNIYKNNYLRNNVDYIGFTHYDIDFTLITEDILQDSLSRSTFINLQPYSFKEDYNQKILMDERHPNRLSGIGVNCYVNIFNDFNSFYNTNYTINKSLDDLPICLCAAFIVKKDIFEEMMKFISKIIESKKLDRFDSKHKYRIQGGLLERYYATWFLLKGIRGLNLELKHEFVKTNMQMSLFKIVKSRISSLLRKFIK